VIAIVTLHYTRLHYERYLDFVDLHGCWFCDPHPRLPQIGLPLIPVICCLFTVDCSGYMPIALLPIAIARTLEVWVLEQYTTPHLRFRLNRAVSSTVDCEPVQCHTPRCCDPFCYSVTVVPDGHFTPPVPCCRVEPRCVTLPRYLPTLPLFLQLLRISLRTGTLPG